MKSHLMLRVALLLGLLASMSVTLADPQISTRRLAEDVKTLSADSFQGRGPGGDGEAKSIDYLIRQMRAAGLQPGGEKVGGRRLWTQDVPLLRSQIAGVPQVQVAVRGKTLSWVQGEQIVVRAEPAAGTEVSVKAAPLVFVGYGVSAPERHWDDFKGIDLKGKIAVVLINDPDFETGVGAFEGKAMTYYGRWTYKYEEGARRGALGVLIVHETEPAAYGWATVRNSDMGPNFDIVRADPAASDVPFEGWIQRAAAVELFREAGLDFDALKHRAQTPEFAPVELDARIDATYHLERTSSKSKNVLGVLPGRTHPDETIIYCAHWDHLGIGPPDARGDTIYNGAIDNATGVAAVLELGRAFAKAARLGRSVLFFAPAAEEQGLLGSKYYAEHPLYPLEKTVGVINMDSMSPYGPARDFSMAGLARHGLLDRLVAVGAQRGVRYTPDSHPWTGGFYRSDHFSFARKGVPAISFKPGEDLLDGGTAAGQARNKDFIAHRYHQPGDEFDPTWSFVDLSNNVGLLYALGVDLGQPGVWPEWAPGSEFEAARDASAAARHEGLQ